MSGETPNRSVVDDLAHAYRTRRAELNAIAARAGAGEGPDLIQEAFLRVIEASEAREVRSPVHMLFRVVQNLVVDRLRSKSRGAALFEAVADSVEFRDETPDPERALIASERLRYALAVIGRMTHKRRTIFLLHRLEGLSYAQIARRTGVGVKTVEKQMAAAMAFLSREMNP